MDSDKFILEKYRNKDTKHYGFNLLVRDYQKKVYWHVRRMVIDHDDANDITQDVFIKIWEVLKNFREESELYTWIYRIATNECLNFLNKKKRRVFLPIANVESELSEKIVDGAYIAGDDIQKKLQNALLNTKEEIVDYFINEYVDEFEIMDIAYKSEKSLDQLIINDFGVTDDIIEEFTSLDIDYLDYLE